MKRELTLALSLVLAFGGMCPNNSVLAKMSPESYKLFQESNILEKNSDFAAAIEKIKGAIELSPDEAILYIKMGGLFSELGDWQNALVAYKKAVKLKPNDAVVYISIGNILQQQQDYENAFAAFNQALTIFPEYKYNYLNLANVKFLQGADEDAIKYYKTFFPNGDKATYYNFSKNDQIPEELQTVLNCTYKRFVFCFKWNLSSFYLSP